MQSSGGVNRWFTAAELADMGLPGLGRDKRRINELANAGRWALRHDARGEALARPRRGRGGGLEYHASCLPPAAMADLARRGLRTAPEPVEVKQNHLWARYDRLAAKAKGEAILRLRTVRAAEQLMAGGHTKTAAIASAAAGAGVASATLWKWFELLDGVERSDHLAAIAPYRRGGGAKAEIHPAAWTAFLSDYLRDSRPTLASCYERLKVMAAGQGWGDLPHWKTFQRRVEAAVDPRLVVAKRHGQEALRATIPALQRSVADLHAMHTVNIDGHKWDVFVRWPDGRIGRPIMVAIQDVFSRKFLSWRISDTESAVLTRLAFADLFSRYGIPKRCLMDNGRAFASKWITGGTPNRYRFKVREEEPVGLLTNLGVEVKWAKPYRGQSKPIERAFRDLCDAVAKHPAFDGAYTGNRPDAKPESYGARAIDLADFVKIASAGIEAHNARLGRRTEMANGRSFDQVFAESYAASPIGKASPAQMRLALLAADRVTADRKSGAIRFCDNEFWTSELIAVAGSKVTVRYDPHNLHAGVHVYDQADRFLATAPLSERVGFADVEGAKAQGRREADLRKTYRRAAELEQLLSAQQFVDLLPDDEPETVLPDPAIIRAVRPKIAAQGGGGSHGLIDRFTDAFAMEAAPERPGLRLVE